MTKYFRVISLIFLLLLSLSQCTSLKTVITGGESDEISASGSSENRDIFEVNKDFLTEDNKSSELFHVILTSDHYIVSQMKYKSSIMRAEDPGGDKYISDEIKKLNKIEETREGLISIWLYPDSGNIMKVRPQQPTYLVEIDKLLTEDIQRWSFKFPGRIIRPIKFDIRYRVILRKTISDEDIIKEVQEKMMD